MNFSDKLEQAIKTKKSCFILGLDPNINKIPAHFFPTVEGIRDFCFEILEATHDLICGVKIQMAYFEVFGAEGIRVVEQLLILAKKLNLVTIIDGKRNDIGSTSEAYAQAYLGNGPLSADCLTVNPLLGTDGITPFIKKCEENSRGIFVLVRTSNPSAIEFQGGEGELSVKIAEKIEEWNITTQSEKNHFSAVGAVIGATLPPKFIEFFREEMPHAWFLMPGVGAQGGDIKAIKKVQRDGLGVLIPVSRSVLYAGSGKDFTQKSRENLQELLDNFNTN